MQLKRIETPGIAHFAYLLADQGEAAVVDPRRDIDEYLGIAREMGVRIRYVIETHRQEDFVMGSAYLKQQTGAQVVNGRHELFGRGDLRLADGEELRLGSLRVTALETPGHTPESMSYAIYPSDDDVAWCVFTGDTLFFGDTGRTDLPDADKSVDNAALLYDSVHDKIAGLADTTFVFPAHGPGSVCGSGMSERPFSTVGEEKRNNKVFVLDRDTFAQEKGSECLPRPPYFRHMEKVNLQGGLPPIRNAGSVRLLDLDSFQTTMEGALVFDTREPEGFAGGHLPNTFSIWLGGLPVFGGWVGNEEVPVCLVTRDDTDVDTAVMHLARIGIDNVTGALGGGFATWRSSGEPIESSGVITPAELVDVLERVQILDVRDADEFAGGHIPGARNIYVGELEAELDPPPFDRDLPVVVTCTVGHRASLAVSILLRAGFADVRNLLGGMEAWGKLELPRQ